jgi:alpha-beta hydrolase superfamily lysophospholipase
MHWRDPRMSVSKWARASCLILATFIIACLIAWPLIQSYLLAHPYRRVADLTGQDTGRAVDRVTFAAADGVELMGWFVPGDGNGATIVVSHGSGANGPGTYPGVAFLNRAGYNVFVFDHRAHGQSSGKFTTIGPLEVRDLRGAVAYVRSRPDVDPARIGAMGCSMGSGVSIGAAAEDPTIRAVVAESVYADMGELWSRFGYVGVRGTPLQWSWGEPMRWATWLWTGQRIATFKPEALISRISPRPILIVHGDQDNAACTVDDARRLYQAAGEPKSLWIVAGAGHCGAHSVVPQAYEARIVSFFDQALTD